MLAKQAYIWFIHASAILSFFLVRIFLFYFSGQFSDMISSIKNKKDNFQNNITRKEQNHVKVHLW